MFKCRLKSTTKSPADSDKPKLCKIHTLKQFICFTVSKKVRRWRKLPKQRFWLKNSVRSICWIFITDSRWILYDKIGSITFTKCQRRTNSTRKLKCHTNQVLNAPFNLLNCFGKNKEINDEKFRKKKHSKRNELDKNYPYYMMFMITLQFQVKLFFLCFLWDSSLRRTFEVYELYLMSNILFFFLLSFWMMQKRTLLYSKRVLFPADGLWYCWTTVNQIWCF